MKKYILITGIILVALVMNLSSCNKDFTTKSPYSTLDGTSMLRIMDLSPNFRNIFSLPDSFNVFINNNLITGYTPSGTLLMTYGSAFPTASSGWGYISIPPGIQQIRLSVRSANNPDSITITSFTKVIQPNSYYSFIITDSINSTRDSSQMFFRDSTLAGPPTQGYFNLRFIHAVLNDTVGKNIDIWSTRTNRNIFANVKPGQITTFSQWAFNALLTDTLYVRRAGTAITLATLNSQTFNNQRTYTLYYRGDGNLTTGTKARTLSVYVNQ